MFQREPMASRTVERRSDDACFSALSDRNGGSKAPPCYRCGKASVGAEIMDLDSGTAVGRPSGTFRFSCGCDGALRFPVYSLALFPKWQLVSQVSPGVWTMRKLSEAEALKRVGG